jgi:hypothetical protein
MRAMLGYAPASPAPNRKRNVSSDTKPVADPDSAVKQLHAITMRVSVPRAP